MIDPDMPSAPAKLDVKKAFFLRMELGALFKSLFDYTASRLIGLILF